MKIISGYKEMKRQKLLQPPLLALVINPYIFILFLKYILLTMLVQFLLHEMLKGLIYESLIFSRTLDHLE